MIFVALETGLKFDDFSRCFWGHPRSWDLVTNNPGSLKPDSRDPETETGNLETERRVHKIHGTLETG